MTKIVVNNLALKYENVKKGVESVMGGKVIEFEAKRIKDAALAEGRAEARAENIVILINILRKYDATEDAIINEIVDTYKLSRKEAEKYLEL